MQEIRPARDDADLEAALRLHNELRPDEAITLEMVHSWLASAPQQRYVALDGGRTIGYAFGALQPGREPLVQALVHPDARNRGTGTRLFDTSLAWVRERSSAPHVTSWTRDAEPEGRAFLERRGFGPWKHELQVALELRDYDPPPVDPPAGIEIVSWAERPDAARGLYEVACEANPDIPGDEQDEIEPYEDWLAHDMGGPGDRPEATFVALAGDEVVGFAKFSLSEAQPTTAHHDLTGVKRAWRGRGIAGALKRAQIAWAKEAGYERLITSNEERNEPIRRLNARLGYGPYGARTLMRAPLSGAT